MVTALSRGHAALRRLAKVRAVTPQRALPDEDKSALEKHVSPCDTWFRWKGIKADNAHNIQSSDVESAAVTIVCPQQVRTPDV